MNLSIFWLHLSMLLKLFRNEPLFIFSQSEQTQVEIIKQRLMNSAFNLTENKNLDIS